MDLGLRVSSAFVSALGGKNGMGYRSGLPDQRKLESHLLEKLKNES